VDTFFGHEEISFNEKTDRIKNLFSRVSSRYDLMNDAMSLGMHRLWKQEFVAQLPIKQNDTILDMAGGTGDISFLIQERYRALNVHSHIADLTFDMMQEGKARAIDRGITSRIEWCNANAELLPYSDNTFDGYVIAFGLRNVANRLNAFTEALRVVKPGGWLFCLEFTPHSGKGISKVYQMYTQKAVPLMGKFIAGDEDAYKYLTDSIETFPNPEEITGELVESGFENVSSTPWFTGPIATHKAFKV
jgi:demethylmenaquinone methyltransferase/2-methoxy-6-polyprenyl-1,4-benzoquinol methylase